MVFSASCKDWRKGSGFGKLVRASSHTWVTLAESLASCLQWQYILGTTQWLKTWYLLTYWEFWSIGPAAHTLSPKRREIHLPSILLLTSVIYTGWKCSPSVSKWKCENKINPPIKTLVVNPHIVDSLFPWPGDGHSQSQKNKFVLHKLYSSGKYHQKPLLTQGLDFIDSTMSSEVFFFFCC